MIHLHEVSLTGHLLQVCSDACKILFRLISVVVIKPLRERLCFVAAYGMQVPVAAQHSTRRDS